MRKHHHEINSVLLIISHTGPREYMKTGLVTENDADTIKTPAKKLSLITCPAVGMYSAAYKYLSKIRRYISDSHDNVK